MGWDVNVQKTEKQNWSHMVLGRSSNTVFMFILMLLMMMMTLMKLVNSAAKFRHGMDKFYQPNSGLRGSKSRDEAIYTTVLQWG